MTAFSSSAALRTGSSPAVLPPAVSPADRLGRGWAFPVQAAGTGRLSKVSGATAVRQSVRLLMATEPGERVMRPDFGCGLRQFLMAPNTPGTRSAVADTVRAALAHWEPRIVVTSVQVSPTADQSVVVITVAYEHVRDGSEGQVQLVLPVGDA